MDRFRTGGMLSTAYSCLKHINPSTDIRLFGRSQWTVICSGFEMIKGQMRDFRHAILKEDCFKNVKMRYLIENSVWNTMEW